MSTAGKSLAAAVTALVLLVVSVVTHSGHPTSGQWLQVAVAVVSAFLVWLAPRTTRYPAVKSAIAAAMWVLTLVGSLIVANHGAMTRGEIINLVLAALGVAAVAKSPAVIHQTAGPVAVTDEL